MILTNILVQSTPYGGRGRTRPTQKMEDTSDKRVDILVNIYLLYKKKIIIIY